jgi:hypothetical protein
MPPSVSSWLGSTQGTSQLEAPSEIQRLNDFRSDRTAISDTPTYLEPHAMDLDWDRLRGYERPPPKAKKLRRQPTSHIWRYGWRLYRPEDGLEYWIDTRTRD